MSSALAGLIWLLVRPSKICNSRTSVQNLLRIYPSPKTIFCLTQPLILISPPLSLSSPLGSIEMEDRALLFLPCFLLPLLFFSHSSTSFGIGWQLNRSLFSLSSFTSLEGSSPACSLIGLFTKENVDSWLVLPSYPLILLLPLSYHFTSVYGVFAVMWLVTFSE